MSGAYRAAGVDVEAGERAVDLMRASIAATRRPEVLGGIGGFAGLFDASALTQFRRPLLATSTDGVGTKVVIAQRMDRHDTIGRDLVAMIVDDLVVCGAEPWFITDYIATGRVVPERIALLVSGIAEGARLAGAALIGGETAEHPGVLGPDEYDLAGAGVGVVEADELLGPDRVAVGDVVIAFQSSGLHSNGYSLARRVFLEVAGWALDRHVPELSRTLGEELLEPTRIYALDVLAVRGSAHAFSHVTGGGIAANLARVIPEHLAVDVDRATWTPPAVFDLIADLGGVERADAEATLNQGVGMIAVVPTALAESVIRELSSRGVRAWACGVVRDRQPGEVGDALAKGGSGGAVRLVGSHPR